MKLLLIVVFLLILLIVAILILIKAKNSRKIPLNNDQGLSELVPVGKNITYKLTKKILSDAEYSFYKSLILVAPLEVIIFSKVRISDVISASGSKYASSSINQKHFDFCILDRKNLDILMVIELDDKSHDSKKVKDRDILVDEVCAQAKLKIVHIPASFSYSTEDLRALFYG